MSSNHPAIPDPYLSTDLARPEDSLAPFRPGVDEEPDVRQRFRRILSALWRYKWLILLVTLAGTAAGYGFASMAQPSYVARTTLWVEQPGGGRTIQGPIQQAEFLPATAWVDLLKSNAVLEPVVRELGLHIRAESPEDSAAVASLNLREDFQPGAYQLQVDETGRTFVLSTADGTVVQRGRVGEAVGAELGFQWQPSAQLLRPGRIIGFSVARPTTVAQGLGQQIVAVSVPNSSFLTLELAGTNPEWVASTLNAVAQQQIEIAAELKRAQNQELSSRLERQVQTAADSLRQAEEALESFRVGTATLPSSTDPVSGGFFTLQTEREELQRQRSALQRALGQAQRGSLSVDAIAAVPAVQNSSELRLALDELTTKQAELRTLRNRYTDQAVQVQPVLQQVNTLERQTIPRLVGVVVGELDRQIASMGQRLSSTSGDLQGIPARETEQLRLARELENATTLYTGLRQRFDAARLAALSSVPDLRILDPATVPQAPNNDSRSGIVLITFLGSLGLGVLGAILLDRSDPRLRYPEQVTQELGLSILGVVPPVKDRGRELDAGSSTALVEALRETRLNLVHAYGTAGPLVVTITSPGSGDGKSFLASHLALAFADLGHKTLLIDGDIRRGELHRSFKGVRRPGLTDFLVGKASHREIVQATAYPSLDLIGCGTRMQSGPELLGSAPMSQLMSHLRSRYSVILVDSPPLGAGVDPFILGTLTGNVLLVLRTGRTNREYAEAKFDLLDRLPIRILGAVLNGVSPRGVYRYYSYLSGYESQDEAEVAGGMKQLEGV